MRTIPEFRRPTQITAAIWRCLFATSTALAMAGAVFEVSARELLFDFGADATQTVTGTPGQALSWNNLANEGTDDAGLLAELVTTDGLATAVSLQMVSRFNGANENGTTTHPEYPASATRDSLFGNTEAFNGIENVTPIFILNGLDPAANYTLTFYASRMGVTDNRETRYSVTGAREVVVDLDVANNVTNTVRVAALQPDSLGQITVALTPGPNNNNANHFVYLGVLVVTSSTGQTILIDAGAAGSPTDAATPPPSTSWNNVTQTIGSNPAGLLSAAVDTNGLATQVSLQIVSRFNGANSNGPTNAAVYPATATQDSLFGNTEVFSELADVLPVFKLTGLDTNSAYTFNFYASRTGVSDNRETRYTVNGANSAQTDLNAANNVTNRATVAGIRPDAAGEIKIALSPGPNNNNANHFTYLGVLQVDETPLRTPRILADLGAAGRPTSGASDVDNAWNNITTDVGGTDSGALTNLVKTDGTSSGITFQMVSRFNGANENGTESSGLYPLDATRDSLFGNTEEFSGLENVTPIFKLTGLNTNTVYDLTFYASRLGVGDNRETRYTVTGASEVFTDLNVANNETEFVSLKQVHPDSPGEITVALTPGPNNDNGNHFVYLGVLQVDWQASEPSVGPGLLTPAFRNGTFSFTLQGASGKSYVIRRTRDFITWEDAQTVALTGTAQRIEIAQSEPHYFYQAVER